MTISAVLTYGGSTYYTADFDVYGIEPDRMKLFFRELPDKQVYSLNEAVDMSGTILGCGYPSDEDNRIDVTDAVTYTFPDMSTPGEKYVKAEFMGMSSYCTIYVYPDMEVTAPKNCIVGINTDYSDEWSVTGASANAEGFLYSVDENGTKQALKSIDNGTVHMSGLGKQVGTAGTYVIGIKTGKGRTYSEPFKLTWADYTITVQESAGSRTVRISNLPDSIAVIAAVYDDDGRFLGLELSEPVGIGTSTRELVIPEYGSNDAETKLFFLGDLADCKPAANAVTAIEKE